MKVNSSRISNQFDGVQKWMAKFNKVDIHIQELMSMRMCG